MLVLMLAGVVHGVNLGHAVGQVTKQPRPDLGVDAFTGGQEPGDFIHALAETGTIFSQDSGVGVQGSCRKKQTGSIQLGYSYAHSFMYKKLAANILDRIHI